MTTAILQCVLAVLKLCFGLTALRVARLTRNEGVPGTAWLVVGLACTAAGVGKVFHSVWALWAVMAGAEAGVYRSYLAWAQPINLGQHALMIVLAVLLLGLPQLHRLPEAVLVRGVCAALLGGLGVGLGAGVLAASVDWGRHYMAISGLDGVEMALLFGALLAALSRGTMDRLLWMAVAIYATRQAFNVLSFAAIAWVEVPDAWSPAPHTIAGTGVVMWTLLLGLALRRRMLAGRGLRSPTLLEPLARRVHSAVG